MSNSFVTAVDCSTPPPTHTPGSPVHEISQARVLEWVAISFSRGFPDPGTEPSSLALAGFFTTEASGKPQKVISKDSVNTSELGKKNKRFGEINSTYLLYLLIT